MFAQSSKCLCCREPYMECSQYSVGKVSHQSCFCFRWKQPSCAARPSTNPGKHGVQLISSTCIPWPSCQFWDVLWIKRKCFGSWRKQFWGLTNYFSTVALLHKQSAWNLISSLLVFLGSWDSHPFSSIILDAYMQVLMVGKLGNASSLLKIEDSIDKGKGVRAWSVFALDIGKIRYLKYHPVNGSAGFGALVVHDNFHLHQVSWLMPGQEKS